MKEKIRQIRFPLRSRGFLVVVVVLLLLLLALPLTIMAVQDHTVVSVQNHAIVTVQKPTQSGQNATRSAIQPLFVCAP